VIVVEVRPNGGHEYGRKRAFVLDGVVQNETLIDQVNRMKHRWLKRVMFDHGTSSSEKCFAYLVVDRLNCVTLDCWPSQKTISEQFGWSIKTVHRVAVGLKRRGHLRIVRNSSGSYRYAPVCLPEDADKSVGVTRQNWSHIPDKNVDESFLGIPFNLSSPSGGSRRADKWPTASNYERSQRGSYEADIAKLLGNDGFGILERLSEHDDDIVERLCQAWADGKLDKRELAAARLAAGQMPRKRRPM
jgi:hypothetical protein